MVAAISYLETLESRVTLAASAVTHMELLIGARDKRERIQIEKFLARFQLIKISSEASDTAVDLLRRYRLSHGLLIADALIAATALVHDAALASRNQRDYRFIAGLNLLTYP